MDDSHAEKTYNQVGKDSAKKGKDQSHQNKFERILNSVKVDSGGKSKGIKEAPS